MPTELSGTDLALVDHMRQSFANADEATKVQLRKINNDGLTDLRRARARLVRELDATDRAIAMREAITDADRT